VKIAMKVLKYCCSMECLLRLIELHYDAFTNVFFALSIGATVQSYLISVKLWFIAEPAI
jgi:hypothetical protein